MEDLELINARITAQGKVIDAIIKQLKEHSSEMAQLMVTSPTINDWCLIRAGLK